MTALLMVGQVNKIIAWSGLLRPHIDLGPVTDRIILIGLVVSLGFIINTLVVSYNWRSSLTLKDVPPKYHDSIMANDPELTNRGFRFRESFLVPIIPKVIVNVYSHHTDPVIIYAYVIPATVNRTVFDLLTYFDDRADLTTTNMPEAINTPRPSNRLLQVFPHSSSDSLIQRHREAVAWMQRNGFTPSRSITVDITRHLFLKYLKEDVKGTVTSFPFWQIRILFWHVFGFNRGWRRPLQEQYPDGLNPADFFNEDDPLSF